MADGGQANRRAFTRVPVHVAARLIEPEGNIVLEGRLNDIALGGLSIDAQSDKAPAGCRVLVSIALEDTWEALGSGTVVRTGESGTAVALEEVANPESYTHLRNLVLYNASEPDRVERELDRHPGISREERDG